jgi:hypothetical protein
MKKNILIITISIIIFLALAYFLKADYYLTKGKYISNPLYCNSDPECRYVKTGCGGCAYTLSNIYSAENRLITRENCRWTTACEIGPIMTTTCENQRCILHTVNETCFKDCFDINDLRTIDQCKKLCIQD